ncbi:glutamate receptor ionotropic, delta-2-like [Bacillus rossius redtenbacheri]|uniref:glutamate receptor ionotropic, delta-2-like n=1 Tax=Bacillus rossius redtenbacheri TaxID=93214 RepID=UPI002FDD4595
MAAMTVLLVAAVLSPGLAILREDVLQMVGDYFEYIRARQVTLLTCSTLDAHKLGRRLGGARTWVFAPGPSQGAAAVEAAARQDYHKCGLFLDLDCPEGERALQLASDRRLLNGSYHWLVWSAGTSLRESELDLELRVDSELVWASPDGEDGMLLHEVYRVGTGTPLVHATAGSWAKPGGLRLQPFTYKYLQRRDLAGVRLRTGITVSPPQWINAPLENPKVNLLKLENRQLDAMATYNYGLYIMLQQQFNFTMDLVVTDKFGFVVEDGNYDGLTRLIGEQQVDTAISTLLMNRPRMDYVDYSTGYGWEFHICAIFRHPSESGGTDALVKPFSGSTWLCTFLMWFVIAAFLKVLAWVQPHYADVTGEDAEEIPSWSDLMLLVVGIVGEQGTWLDSKWFTWRFVFFLMLLLTVLLNTFYAAIVVSTLLNQQAQTINTAKDLIDSHLHFGAEDIIYNRPYFEVVLKENFAFHTEAVRAYPVIESMFPDEKKCALKEIELFPVEMGFFAFPFMSPYKKMFTYGMRKIAETGLWQHQNHEWRPSKPTCASTGAEVISVDLSSLTPAFGLLAIGCALSMVVLVLENLHAKFHHQKFSGNTF